MLEKPNFLKNMEEKIKETENQDEFEKLKEKIERGEGLNDAEEKIYIAEMRKKTKEGKETFSKTEEKEYKEADEIKEKLEKYKISQEVREPIYNVYYRTTRDTLIPDMQVFDDSLSQIRWAAATRVDTLEKFLVEDKEKEEIFERMLKDRDIFLKLMKQNIDFFEGKISKADFFNDPNLEGKVELEIPEFAKGSFNKRLIEDLYEEGKLIQKTEIEKFLKLLEKSFKLTKNYHHLEWIYPKRFLDMAKSLEKQLGYQKD